MVKPKTIFDTARRDEANTAKRLKEKRDREMTVVSEPVMASNEESMETKPSKVVEKKTRKKDKKKDE